MPISSPKKTRTRKPKLKFKYPIIIVLWDDAETAGGWEEIPEEIKPAIATSVGFLVKESEEHILLVGSYDDRHTNCRIQIPKRMIIEMTTLVRDEIKKTEPKKV